MASSHPVDGTTSRSMPPISPHPMRSRAQSTSSDRPSTIGHGLIAPPSSVSPQAAFIATSAASQIVTNDHDSHANKWYDQHGIEPAGEAAYVSDAALKLANAFLDQLLFNFLQISRATTLRALRPAVSEVLKPKLAKDAINNADEELREYLGGADEEDYVQPQGATSPDWDLELVWKRTRLRCMVYSSLGDLEEEDEDLYMEQENLEIGVDEQISDVISPAVAIFLTSVLEYMGELTLTVAGQAAYHRMRAKLESELKDGTRSPSDIADRITVEELDMERVALDRTLGRLWRGWKKRIRAPVMDLVGRPYSRNSSSHARHDSTASEALSPLSIQEDAIDVRRSQDPVEATIAEEVQPADIALPMGFNDVDEIEVPGLAPVIDDDDKLEEGDEDALPVQLRPQSLFFDPAILANGLPTPTSSQPNTPVVASRKRSNSVPTPGASAFYPVVKRQRKAAQEEDVVAGEADEQDPKEQVNEDDKNKPEETESEKADAAVVSDEPDDAYETASEQPVKNERLSRLVTSNTATRGVKTAEEIANDVEEPTTYEKAEIMTSARISMNGSSSPSTPDSGKPFALKRSSSVCSARIIDVVGPKSPTGSRPPSVDATERSLPVSLSRTSSGSTPSITEEAAKVKAGDAITRTTNGQSARSNIERVRPTMQNATTISESEEEADVLSDLVDKPSEYSHIAPHAVSTWGKTSQAGYGSARKSPPRHEPSSKVTIIGTSNSGGSFAEDDLPEVPHRSPIRPGPRKDSIGMVSVDRTRTMESEDEPSWPIQSNASPRPIHTSGSSASSGTGRLRPVRTSEETPSRAESVARNFEELIHSNQTITYTLTPENMRDIDSKRSLEGPVVTKVPRKSEDVRMYNQSPSSPAVAEMKTSAANRGIGPGSPVSRKFSVPESLTTSGSAQKTSRMSASLARDARVPTESTAEFAEFIKSTGPPGDTRPAPVRVTNGRNGVAKQGVEPPRASMLDRPRYLPRDAVVDTRADNDLIDFIRQGPPGSAATRNLPRHLASDQMSSAIHGRPLEPTIPEVRNSQASTNMTENSMPSMQSSVNSSSALLKKNAPLRAGKMFDEDDMMPKRTKRGPRDPYAIDFSDEEDEDDDFIVTPKPPPKKEETLAEFLRNYQPPPEPVTRSISQKMPKKKSSAPSLISMSRLLRSGSKDLGNHGASISPATESRSLGSRTGGKGFIPIQVNMPAGYDKYGPIDTSAGRPRQPSAAASLGKVPMKKFEPRAAVPSATQTADLAAFLRDSEPPSNRGVARSAQPDEPTNFSKVFSRRKKSAMA